MRRDSIETRGLLLAAAESCFADAGIFRTTLRAITEAAGQRNTSAVSYHFGSRRGLIEELLSQRGRPLDQQRGVLLAAIAQGRPTTADLVGVLVTPLVGCLRSQEGRYYLRIVVQLTGQFAQWRDEGPQTGPNLRQVLGELEARPTGCAPEARSERLIALMMLLTAVMAERARLIDAGGILAIDPGAFEANLVDMLVAVIDAPVAGPVPA